MKLIITRHGETEENKAGIIQGHLPGKLSKDGINQAKQIAIRLRNENINYIYSSDLARASDTAKEIAKFHQKIPIDFVIDLRERNFGELQEKKITDIGLSIEELKVRFKQLKDGETLQEIYNRAEHFLHKIIEKHYQDTVLLIGHNDINRNMIAIITGKKVDEVELIELQHNTSINIFDIDEDRNYKIHSLNCIRHLN